jgi:hypothetical protein
VLPGGGRRIGLVLGWVGWADGAGDEVAGAEDDEGVRGRCDCGADVGGMVLGVVCGCGGNGWVTAASGVGTDVAAAIGVLVADA